MPDDVTPAAPVTPPAATTTDDTAQRLQALEKQNRELALYAAYMEQQTQKPAPAAVPSPEEDDTPPETRQLRGQVTNLEEQLDRMQFNNLAQGSGLTPEDIKATEEQLILWRRAGMNIVDQSGAKRQPNRADAVRQVLGAKALAESQKAAPTRIQAQLRGMMGGDVPGGAPTTPAAQVIEPDKYIRMTSKDRIKLAEDALKDGF